MPDHLNENEWKTLSRNEFLGELSKKDIEDFLAIARRRNYPAKTDVFHKGDPGDSLFVILKGQIGISSESEEGQSIFLNVLGPSEIFGEIALIDGRNRTAGATALRKTELLRISRVDFIRYLEHHPNAALRMMNILCERLRWVSGIVEDSIFLPIPQRLAKRLCILMESHGISMKEGILIDVHLPQEKLGFITGATRESVNKCMRELVKAGVLSYRRGAIIVRDRKLLKKAATMPKERR